MFALAEGIERFVEDFGKAGVLLDPVGQGPDQEGQDPMTLDLFLVTDLVLVEAEVVFEFAERFFDSPAQEISEDSILNGYGKVIGDQDVNIFVIGVRPFIKDKEDLQRG